MTGKFYAPDLAELHDLYYSDYVERAAPGALAILRNAGIRSGAVLDLGCGGGQLSLRLFRDGLDPVAIDVSAAMIRRARKRVPAARFILGSVSEIALPPCRAAVAIGEVFNYLPSKAAMQRAFRNVFQSLASGGILAFDAKLPLPGQGKKFRTAARWGDDWAVFAETVEDPRQQILVRRIASFRKSGASYRRRDEVHRQTILKVPEFVKMLEATGFAVAVLGGYQKFVVPEDRKVFVARKPA